jgi:predicted O-methyltransferase YrrM
MERGTVVLTDGSAWHLSFAREVFEEAGLTRRAVFHEGDALRTARHYEGIEILFIDIDKKDYLHAAESLLGNLAPHGMVIADNALWYGRVLDKDPDEDTRGIMAFNEFMASREDFHTTILPLRDGLLLGQKLL